MPIINTKGIQPMTYPASAPRRYTTSRQLIGGDDFNNVSDHSYSFASIAALGTTQGTATAINAANVEVTLANSINNGGVLLPIAYPGGFVNILNNSGQTTKIYPQANGDVIQNSTTGYAAANTAITAATNVPLELYCVKKGFWQVTKSIGP